MIYIPIGFVTDNFVSAFNEVKQTLTINNLDTGAIVDGYSIMPNDSYITQDTGFGTIKTVWSHLSLSGDVTIYLKYLTEDKANYIDTLFLRQDTNYYVAFLGYMFRTEAVDVGIKPNMSSIDKLDVTLTFYGKLPYSSPIFRPGFSTKFSSLMHTDVVSSTPSILLAPLPGATLYNREDSVLSIVKQGNSASISVFSDITTYTSTTSSLNYNISSNYGSGTVGIGLIQSNEGLDVLGAYEITGNTINVRFLSVKNNTFNGNYRNIFSTNVAGITRASIQEGFLYCYIEASTAYIVYRYDLTTSDIAGSKKTMQDSTAFKDLSVINNPVNAPLLNNGTAKIYTLSDNKTKFIGLDTGAVIGTTYDSYIMPLDIINQVSGALYSPSLIIENVQRIQDGKLIIFLRNMNIPNTTARIHYIIVNFRDYDAGRDNWTNPVLTDYKVTDTELPAYTQLFTYLGITQTNTAVIANNNMYMSTEAYTDYYVEPNVLAVTVSTFGNKYFAVQEGNNLNVKLLSK